MAALTYRSFTTRKRLPKSTVWFVVERRCNHFERRRRTGIKRKDANASNIITVDKDVARILFREEGSN